MKLHEAQEKGIPRPCCVCGKLILDFYGRWGVGGSCSKKCEAVQEAKPKYPPPKENDNAAQKEAR